MSDRWGKVWEILRDQDDKSLWRQLLVTLVDKGLLGLMVVAIGLVGNWILEEHKVRQAQAQTQAQFLFGKRLEAIQQIADAYGKLTGGYLASTVQGGIPSKSQLGDFDRSLEQLYLLTNQYEVVLPEDFADELERQLWAYKGMTHEAPADWKEYRGFVTDLASSFETSWRLSLPPLQGESTPRRPEMAFPTIQKSVQDVTREGTKKYFEENFALWRKKNSQSPAPKVTKPSR